MTNAMDEGTTKERTQPARRRRRHALGLRKKACRKLGIPDRDSLIYGAQAAADALGVSIGMLKKHVNPAEYADNPYYRHAGAPVGLYDPIDLAKALTKKAVIVAREKYAGRKDASAKALQTRMANMEAQMREAKITIVRGWSDDQIRDLALSTHGGNYRGDPGPFVWSNLTALNCIRHNLTNYESLWSICNRGSTGGAAYEILRERVDALVAEAYPRFC